MRSLIVLAVLLLVLISPCLSSTDYRVGQGARLDESLTYTSAYGVETAGGIASSGSMYFVTWMGLRDWLGGDVFGTRVAQDGTVLDPGGIKFASFSAGRSSVCWNGSSFFVVYVEDGTPDRVRAARVSPEGTVLDDPHILVASTASANPTAVSWDGANHVVVWEDRSVGASDIYMVRVNGSGTVLDATPRPVSTRTTSETYPQVASSPSGLSLIVWQDYRNQTTSGYDIYGALVNSNGTLISPAEGIPIFTGTGTDSNPTVCWTQDHFRVAWAHSNTSGNPTTILDIGVSVSGTLKDPLPIIVSTGTEYRLGPRIAYNGVRALVTWTQSTSTDSTTRDVWGGRLSLTGQPLDGNGFPICELAGSQNSQLVSSAGTEFLSVWNDSSLGGIFATFNGDRISGEGTLIPSTVEIATAPPYQEFPSVAFSGQEYLACWMEMKGGKRCVYGAFVDEYIEKPRPQPSFCIDPDVTLSKWNDPSWVQAVWNGQDYVVTWNDGSCNKAMRIKRDGTILDPDGIVVGDNSGVQLKGYPGLASDGNNCLIVHQIGQYVHAVLMARDGSIIADRQIEDLGSINAASTVRAYWTGQVYVLLKQDNLIQILDRDANPVSSYTVPAGPGGNIGLAVGRTNCLLVWSEGAVVKSRRLGLDGMLVDAAPTTLATSSYDPAMPSVCWDGKHYLVFFYDYKFKLVRVTEENTLVDASPLNFSSSHEVGWWAVPCAGPKGKTLVAYCDWEPAPRNAMRIEGQLFYSYIDLAGIREAIDLENGTYVNVTGKVATAVFPVDNWAGGEFYVQDDRTCGIRVDNESGNVSAGDLVSLQGVMSEVDGERTIVTPEAAILSRYNPLPRPLGLTLRDLGGVPPTSHIEPISGVIGAYNVGLYAKLWGRVTYSAAEYFYIDDGSRLDDGSGRVGVKVLLPWNHVPPHEGDVVQVYGISGAERSGDRIIRVVRAKSFVKL